MRAPASENLMVIRNRFLNRLAAASVALGSCCSLPSEALADWVEAELERDPETTPLQAVNTAGRVASGARAAVAALWQKSHEASEAFVANLAGGDSAALRIAAAGALGQILELASPMERIEIVCRWTVSEETSRRLAVARALALPLQAFVTDLALDQLARDSNAEVRVAAAQAARVYAQGSADFSRILEELARDPVRAVRTAALPGRPGELA